MMNTSLGNIISRQSSSLHDAEVKLLFQQKEHPCFELTDFHKHTELLAKEQFLFFLRILEKWNQQVASAQQPLSDCAFARHQFIFSWLKSLAVLNRDQIDPALQQLFDWYNSARTSEPRFLIRKEVGKLTHLEEWEIRNSYKSNLPLEIDSYKRRLLVHHPDDRHSRTAAHSPSPDKENRLAQFQRQNSQVKGQKEQQEVESYLSNYRKSKLYFFKNMAKDFYRKEFDRDKLSTSSGFYRPKNHPNFFPTDEIKSYRIKTTAGARPLPNKSQPKATLTTSYLQERELGDEECRLMPSNINGLGLIGNPFELKLRKKKKK